MVAKPIIDLIVVIEAARWASMRDALAAIGYRHEGDLGIDGREAFALDDPVLAAQMPPHHLYVCPESSEELRRQMAFRDMLCHSPQLRAELSELKWQLAGRYGDDRQAYMEGKAALVRRIASLALQAAPGSAT